MLVIIDFGNSRCIRGSADYKLGLAAGPGYPMVRETTSWKSFLLYMPGAAAIELGTGNITYNYERFQVEASCRSDFKYSVLSMNMTCFDTTSRVVVHMESQSPSTKQTLDNTTAKETKNPPSKKVPTFARDPNTKVIKVRP